MDSASRFSRLVLFLFLSVFYHDYDYDYDWLSPPSIWVSRSVERDRAIVRVVF